MPIIQAKSFELDGEMEMVKTITVGNYISVQGIWVRDLADGRMVVRVGKREFVGRPVVKELATA